MYPNYFYYFIESGIIFGLFILFWKFFFENYLKNLIQYRIKLENDKLLEDYKAEEIKRHKAAIVVNLLSEWLDNYHKKEPNLKLLNQLTFEAYLWLPKDIANKLTKRLINAEDAPHLKEIISDVRDLLLGIEQHIDPISIVDFYYPDGQKV